MRPLDPTSSTARGRRGRGVICSPISVTVQVILEGEDPGTLESQPGLAGISPAVVVVVVVVR